MRKAYILAMMIMITGLVMLSACQTTPPNTTVNGGPDLQVQAGDLQLTGTDELKKFTSKAEIISFLKLNTQSTGYNSFGRGMMGDFAMVAEDSAGAAPTASKASNGAGADEYSTTNIQVAGVDEADFIKNDGKYIYMITNNKLVIVEAYPAEDAEIVSETNIKGYAQELFLKGDTLVVFTQASDETYGFAMYDVIPRPMYKTKTVALVLDISDRENPEVVHNYDVSGYYVTSRMIGDHVYMVAQEGVYYYSEFIDLPVVRDSAKIVARPEVYYFDNHEDNYNFNTVMGIDIVTGDVDAKTFMMGYGNTIYVSEDNMYITYQKNTYYGYYGAYSQEMFRDAVLPLLPADIRAAVDEIDRESISEAEKWDKISAKLEEMYNTMEEGDKQDFMENVDEAVREYQVKREEERSKTVIHRLRLDDGVVSYGARGEVKGYLLNQFSLDESEGNLRVATTFNAWVGESVQYNNVYVLDSGMKVIGSLEKIAPDERIYSTRFIGDRLYMVTFKQIDPLFVIDMGDATSPKILGELKIPGFSNYLHPYDEDHIIGVGKDTAENEWGGISTKGVKIALFDVSDVENPKQVDQVVIGQQGTDSEALYDHKAFLFDRNRNLLVMPIREVKDTRVFDNRWGYYTTDIWQGAYVFHVTDESIETTGKITHTEGSENYWYSGDKSVRRSLFMDNVLYTVSNQVIKMNDLETLESIGSVELPSQYVDDEWIYKERPIDVIG
jgi:inhibitor of cysteine peptidase